MKGVQEDFNPLGKQIILRAYHEDKQIYPTVPKS